MPLNSEPVSKVIINDTKIRVLLADTAAKQYKGLSDRDNICAQCGMLFVFDQAEEKTFVMRRMRFPLDIIWIYNDKIVKIDKNLPPEGERPTKLYSSGQPVSYVLEVNAGFCDKYDIKKGDKVIFNDK